MAYLYALRCLETDLPELIENATLLGVIELIDGKPFEKNGGCWDHIGYKLVGDPPSEGGKDTRSYLADSKGVKYVHINVTSPLDVDAIARELAGQYPKITAALGDPSRFFVTDGNGAAKDPEFPMRVFL